MEENIVLPSKAQKRKIRYLQICLGLFSNISCLSAGMSLGYSAIALPQLMSPSNPFQLTTEQASWFASLAVISVPLGCIICGPLLDRFGRKKTLAFINIPLIVGWLIIATTVEAGSGQVVQLYVGRFLLGIAEGLCCIPSTIYVAEIASDTKMRSMLVTWLATSFAGGTLIVYILGEIFQKNWRLIAVIGGSIPIVLFFLILIFLPESPVWLLAVDKPKEALQALKQVRGEPFSKTSSHVQSEFDRMVHISSNEIGSGEKLTFLNNLKLLRVPEAYKPLLIMIAYFFFQQVSGSFVLMFYTVDMVHQAGITVDSYLATVLIGLVRFLATVIVSVTSTSVGRREASIGSGVCMSTSMGVLSLLLFLTKTGVVDDELWKSISWIPFVLLLFFSTTASLGMMSLPWAMLGEVFPTRVSGLACAIATCTAYIFSFLMIKTYPGMSALVGNVGVFFFYSVMALLGTVFIGSFLPETRGKSLQEIEEYFSEKPTDEDDPDSLVVWTASCSSLRPLQVNG